jgi:hypothetical protein
LAIVWSSCKQSRTDRKVDVSRIKIDYKSVRFDKELYACDTTNLEVSINQLGSKYPDFASVYFNELTGFAKTPDNGVFINSVRHFLTYKDYRALFDSVFAKYPDVKEIDAQIEMLYKHIKYYFPKRSLGTVYYFTTGLNFWSAVTIDSSLGIGLDMHLGKQYPFYASVQIPDYQIERCEKEYIPVNAARSIYQDMVPFDANGKTLLDLMIEKGKEQLFLEYTLPDAKEELLIGYTPEQLQWCKENEGMIWSYFAKQKLLYSTQWQEILRYVNDGPNSTGMPPESPGNIGSWIGWQLVHKYLDEHPEVKWNEFVYDKTDAQTILRESKYKPR